jgi:uncharacterized repeat protein (TIGR04076 family)
MFKVKATVVQFLGDEEKYPCHFGHKVGDEFIYDGEKFHGRICPHALPVVMPHLCSLYDAGPRYVQPAYYVPFWYVPETERDPRMKTYDGVGWKVRRSRSRRRAAWPYTKADSSIRRRGGGLQRCDAVCRSRPRRCSD